MVIFRVLPQENKKLTDKRHIGPLDEMLDRYDAFIVTILGKDKLGLTFIESPDNEIRIAGKYFFSREKV